MRKYVQGIYNLKNPDKYLGKRRPRYRSSWEWTFMQFVDNNPHVKQWASEAISIPYFNPLTNKKTKYVPDFFIVYEDKTGETKTEIIELKPSKEVSLESAGRSARNQAMAIINQAKWQAAISWCNDKGIAFRVITEKEMFHQNKKR